ncbi:MAG: ARPP-1 family domain-containing protein [bacterium]
MNTLTLTEPIFLRNLMIYPINNGNDGKKIAVNTIEDNIEYRTGAFHELGVPDINKVIFDNQGNLPVLMIDGEEITGSLQNRIIAQSTMVEAHTKTNIPVICAEQNRWKELGTFKTGYCSYPKIRSILAESKDRIDRVQEEVWKEIARKLTVTRTKSRTSSMHEIYDNLEEEVERYLEGFEGLNHHTIGFIGVAGNRILGCDIFRTTDIYHKFEKKLLRSYALDALEYQQRSGRRPAVKDFFARITKKFTPVKTKKSLAHLRFNEDDFVGQAIFYKNEPVHISAFSR